MQNIKYKVRPGTIDLGKEYESKILTLLSLQCLNYDKEDFWFAFNADGVGDFDDVILHHGENTFMLQIKHKENSLPITERELLASPKDYFSFQRYVQDIYNLENKLNSSIASSAGTDISLKLGNFDKIKFLLYTNRDVKPCSFLNEINDENYKILSYLNSVSNLEIFQFDLTKLPSHFSVDTDKFSSKNFFLCPKQIYAKDVNKRIEEEIYKLIKTENVRMISENFIKFINEWGKGNLGGYYCLTRQDINLKLSELLFDQYEVKLLQEPYNFYECQPPKCLWNRIIKDKTISFVDISFNDKIFLSFLLEYLGNEVRNYCNVIDKRNWSCTLSQEDQNLFYSNNTDLKLCMLQIIGNRGKITLNDIYRCLCNTKQLPLLLEIKKEDQYEHICDILNLLNCSYNVILLNTTNKCVTVNSKLLNSNSVDYFRNLQDLTKEYVENILDLQIKLQGRPGIKLKYLVDETMFTLINTADIINILLGNFNIGEELDYVPKYYIQRKLTKIYIKLEALKKVPNEIFLIEDTTNAFEGIAKKENLKISFLNEIVFEDFAKYHVVIYNYKLCKKQIEEILSLKQIVHCLIFHNNDYLEWKRSSGSIENIKNYQVEFGNVLESNIDFSASLTTIISASPGMGKSMLIDHIARKAPTDKWILKINLNKYQDYYEDDYCKDHQTQSLKHLNHFRNHSENELENKIFKKLLMNKNVIILLDGFDEISISYKDEVTNIARSFVNNGFYIWLTTRPLMKSYLEEKFSAFALNLIPFSEDNQKQFLIKYFHENSKELSMDSEELLDTFIKKLLIVFKRNINDQNADFTGTPLHIKLLAESFSDSCEEYLFSKGMKGFNENFDLLDLYHKFIKKKINILCDKFGVGSKDLRTIYKDYQSLYALRLLFPLHTQIIDEYLNNSYQYKKDNIQLVLKEGLLTVDEEFNINFVHRTFAEYLAAEWLSQNFSNENENIKYITKTLVAERFTQNYKFLFTMFDRILVKGCKLHMIMMNGQANEVCDVINKIPNSVVVKDKARRSILHLLALYAIQYPLLINICPLIIENMHKEMPKLELDLLGYNPIDYALGNRSFNIANIICDKWKYSKININVDTKLQGRYLNCALADYKSLFDCLLSYFAYKDLICRNIRKEEPVSLYLKKFHLSKSNHLKKYTNTTVLDILNLEESAHNSNILHEIVFGCKTTVKKLLDAKEKVNVQDDNGNTYLHYAVLHEQLEVIDLLLCSGVNINLRNCNGETPLHIGVQHGYLEVVDKLLSYRANLEVQNTDGNTPLHMALLNNQAEGVRHGYLKVVDKLSSYRANLEVQNTDGNTPLHMALLNNQAKAASLLINNGADVNISNNDRNTCIHLLIKSNFDNILEKIFSKGIYQDKKNFSGETPLYLALSMQNFKAAKMLIDNGADINTQDIFGRSILHVAISTRNVEIVRKIISKGAILDLESDLAIHIALKDSNTKIMKLLLDNGCNINAVDMNKKTVLHYAAEHLNSCNVETILSYSACINKQDDNGNTPLHLVLLLNAPSQYDCKIQNYKRQKIKTMKKLQYLLDDEEGDLEELKAMGMSFRKKQTSIAKLLITHGADINADNYKSQSPVHLIFENNVSDIISEILNNKLKTFTPIDFNKTDYSGDTLLHIAIKKSNFDCVKSIISKNATMVNQQNNEGNTPLHTACQMGKLEIIKLLCQNGADINKKNHSGSTALHIIVNQKHFLILKEFLELDNININEVDENGRTVLHIATEINFNEVVVNLLEHGCYINCCDNDDNTALHLAVQNNLAEIVEILMDYKPDIDIYNNNKKTAQSLAYEKGNEEIIHLFQKYCIQLFYINQNKS